MSLKKGEYGRYLHSVETAKPMGYLKPKTKTKKEGFGIGFGMNYSL